MKIITKLLFAIAFLSYAEAKANDEWYELVSDHFILRTDTNLEKARKTIEDLEKYRFTIGAITGLDLSEDYSPPLVIYAFNTTKRFRRTFSIRGGTLGFYNAFEDGAISMLSLEDGDQIWQLNGLRIIFHEYSHHILHQYSPLQYPRWYDEGFGEYLGMTEFDGDTAIIGKPAVHRFPSLKRPSAWHKLKVLMRSKGEYLAGTQQYSQGWLITHFFQGSEKYTKQLNMYLNLLNQPGIDNDKAFKKAFGKSYSKMDKEIKRYWYNRELPTYSINLEGILPEISIETRKLDPAEVAIMHHEARHLSGYSYGNEAEYIKTFEQALLKGVRPIDLHRYLANLLLNQKNWDKANNHIQALLAKNPDYAPALVMKTRLLWRGRRPNDISKEEMKNIRKATIKALKADQSYVPGLMAYAGLFMLDEMKVTDNALDIMETIRFLVPDVESAKILQVNMLAKAGKQNEAVAKVQKLIDWARSNRERKRYEELLESINNTVALKASSN